MKGVDAIARILKVEGAEFRSVYPTTSLIEAAAALDIRLCCAATSAWASALPTWAASVLTAGGIPHAAAWRL